MWLTDAWKHFEFCSLAHTVWHETVQLGSLLWKGSQNSVLLQTCKIYFHVCTVLLYVMMELMLWDMAGSHMKARQRYAMAPSKQHIYIWGGKFWEAKITWHKVKVSVSFQTMNRYAVWHKVKKIKYFLDLENLEPKVKLECTRCVYPLCTQMHPNPILPRRIVNS